MELRLTDAVQNLREELTEAVQQAEAENPDVTLEVGPIQMEFEIQFRYDAKAKGKVAAWILSGEVESGMGRSRTHKVAFTLIPRNKNHSEGTAYVGSDDPDHAGPGDRFERIEP